jgi:hypothetical protein
MARSPLAGSLQNTTCSCDAPESKTPTSRRLDPAGETVVA